MWDLPLKSEEYWNKLEHDEICSDARLNLLLLKIADQSGIQSKRELL